MKKEPRFPISPELRELGLSLKKAGISLEEAKEGADLLQSINRLGIPLDKLSEAVDFYEQQGQRLKGTNSEF